LTPGKNVFLSRTGSKKPLAHVKEFREGERGPGTVTVKGGSDSIEGLGGCRMWGGDGGDFERRFQGWRTQAKKIKGSKKRVGAGRGK